MFCFHDTTIIRSVEAGNAASSPTNFFLQNWLD